MSRCSTSRIAREAAPLIAVVITLIFVMALFPGIVMFLPNLLMP